MKRIFQTCGLLLIGLVALWSCGFDSTLREYLSAQFWMPFSKAGGNFVKKDIPRLDEPFAGMDSISEDTPLTRLRKIYQNLHNVEPVLLKKALSDARAASNLRPEEKEEIELLDAKFDIRAGTEQWTEPWQDSKKKLEQFLKTARTPAYLSEARGWLAHIHYLAGEQSAAGKIYLDELNRSDSNLSHEVLINSLRLNYGYNGGPKLRAQLQDYFDTPEHAAFAIHLVTNPSWTSKYDRGPEDPPSEPVPLPYSEINALLQKHAGLLRSERGANVLALMAMRTALRAGDPPAALRLAANIPGRSSIRAEPDFLWMLASGRFLSKDFKAAEAPLLQLFQSARASRNQKAAAAYGLCGVYKKLVNPVEQLRFASWLSTANGPDGIYYGGEVGVADQSIYWAYSGWDRNLLLEIEAPVEALRQFTEKYPRSPGIQLVRYSLGVRLARENQYEEAAQVFESITARLRARRMREMAALYRDVSNTEQKFKLAAYLSENSERIYFNDRLWSGLQRNAFTGGTENRFTRAERDRQIALERKLKDDQEELWRAHLILREIAREAGPTDLGRRSAELAIRCLRRLSDRFDRPTEILAAEIELASFLRSRK